MLGLPACLPAYRGPGFGRQRRVCLSLSLSLSLSFVAPHPLPVLRVGAECGVRSERPFTEFLLNEWPKRAGEPSERALASLPACQSVCQSVRRRARARLVG